MRTVFVISVLVLLTASLSAQQVTPAVISSVGGYGSLGNVCLSWTLGETFSTTLDNGSNVITQGFHQPRDVNDSIPFQVDTSGFIPTGITPNADGLNDSWVIDGIDTVANSVFVFNRWGDLVWKANDYNNTSIVWKGDNLSGAALPAATYFFVIVTERRTDKGWIELLK